MRQETAEGSPPPRRLLTHAAPYASESLARPLTIPRFAAPPGDGATPNLGSSYASPQRQRPPIGGRAISSAAARSSLCNARASRCKVIGRCNASPSRTRVGISHPRRLGGQLEPARSGPARIPVLRRFLRQFQL